MLVQRPYLVPSFVSALPALAPLWACVAEKTTWHCVECVGVKQCMLAVCGMCVWYHKYLPLCVLIECNRIVKGKHFTIHSMHPFHCVGIVVCSVR